MPNRASYTPPVDSDLRNIRTGREIPTEYYSDQPYLVKTDDGGWLLVVTTGAGVEGSGGQHVVSMRSEDCGRSWFAPVDVEPANGPEASYAVLLQTPYGRVYCFYNHNTDNLRAVRGDDPPFTGGLCSRVDSLGHFVYRFTDDGGRTWSQERYEIPQRLFQIDSENPYGGSLLFFWNVGKPFSSCGRAYVPIHKVGGFGEGFFTRSEGALLMSDNLMTERDPHAIRWQTLPDGVVGLRPPAGAGSIAEEQSFVVASDGSIHAVYRTVSGHPACSVSRDGGHTFSAPAFRQFADGRVMRHPRAANFTWKCSNGKYLYWFHNHGGQSYEDRNPVWLCGGEECETDRGVELRWSQPELILYDDDPIIRISYPDLLEDGGRYYLTETQKDAARVHELDADLLEDLWSQLHRSVAISDAPLLEASGPAELPMPPLPLFTVRDNEAPDYRARSTRNGVSVLLEYDAVPQGILVSNRTADGRGLEIRESADGVLTMELSDGINSAIWHSDPVTGPGAHTVCFLIDGGPHIICVIADGLFQDGSGSGRQFGFGRFSPWLTGLDGGSLRVSPAVRNVRIFGRALRVGEAISDRRSRLS